jgi:hypothetical protein
MLTSGVSSEADQGANVSARMAGMVWRSVRSLKFLSTTTTIVAGGPMAHELRLGIGKELPLVEHLLSSESEQANRREKPKREGDLRKAEQRTRPRRIGDRRNNWRGQIEFEQWQDKGRRRSENERRSASKELRQTERRGAQGDRRKEPPERRAVFNPKHRRSTDFDYRIHNNEDRSKRAEVDGYIGVKREESIGKQGLPGSTTYSPRVPMNIPKAPSEPVTSDNFIQSFIQAGERLWERLFGSSH